MGEQAEFALAIPAAYQQFLATEKMVVSQLSACVYIPRDRDRSISIVLSERPPNISLSADSPLALVPGLEEAGIVLVPLSQSLSTLKRECLKSKSTSYKSISSASSPERLLPLWMVSFLLGLDSIYACQYKWNQSLQWLRKLETKSGPKLQYLCDEIEKSFDTLSVAGPIQGLTTPTSAGSVLVSSDDLTSLLSNMWLSNFNIDPLITLLNREAEHELTDIRSLTLGESTRLLELFVEGLPPILPRLARLESHVQSGSVRQVLIPAFINNNHFTLFSIDFIRHTYAYADSLDADARPPQEHRAALKNWAEHVADCEFRTNEFGSFRIPAQNDSFSCGVVVLSSIAAVMLGIPGWNKSIKDSFRLFWFVWSVNVQYDKVSLTIRSCACLANSHLTQSDILRLAQSLQADSGAVQP